MDTNEESDINSQPIVEGAGEPQSSGRDEKGHFLPGVLQEGAIPFKPGEGGNPRGGSAKQRMTSALLQAMNKKEGIDEALANVVLSKGLKGDIRFIELIYDRIDGKPKQDIGISGELGLSPWAKMSPAERMAALERSMDEEAKK